MIDTTEMATAFMEILEKNGTEDRAVQEKRYLKSPMMFHGVTLPFINRTAKEFYKSNKDISVHVLWGLVEKLWNAGYHDTRSLAIELLCLYVKLLQPEHMPQVESLLRQSCTWDHVDEISARLSGSLVDRFPELKATLERWSGDNSFWMRRASMLSLLIPLREGRGDLEFFFRLAEPMLHEKEFFIRKAIGWILRDTARKRPEPVIRFLEQHLNEMSGLTFREALKHLPQSDQCRLKDLRETGARV